jgi:hypothetical protein
VGICKVNRDIKNDLNKKNTWPQAGRSPNRGSLKPITHPVPGREARRRFDPDGRHLLRIKLPQDSKQLVGHPGWIVGHLAPNQIPLGGYGLARIYAQGGRLALGGPLTQPA